MRSFWVLYICVYVCAQRPKRALDCNNYCIFIESLAVVWSLDQFNMYLEGRHFTVLMGHKPLTYLRQLNQRALRKTCQFCVCPYIYDLTIRNCPGRLMTVADALSRTPIHAVIIDSCGLIENCVRPDEGCRCRRYFSLGCNSGEAKEFQTSCQQFYQDTC